jgi:hypothetical protein
MMSARTFLARAAERFRRDDRGMILVEFIIALPLLVWGYIGMITYYDAFRTLNELGKATFTVGDLLTRQQVPVDNAFLEGLADIVEYTTRDGEDVALRFTRVDLDINTLQPVVIWSYSPRGRRPVMATADLTDFEDQIPRMYDPTVPGLPPRESLVLVESWLEYTPLARGFDIGLTNKTFAVFEPFEPRYTDGICLTTVMATCKVDF